MITKQLHNYYIKLIFNKNTKSRKNYPLLCGNIVEHTILLVYSCVNLSFGTFEYGTTTGR